MSFDLSKLASCGEDVRIADTAIIKRPELCHIGSHVAIDDFVYISTQMELGSHIHIPVHCSVIGGPQSKLVLEDFVAFAAGCRIVCGSDDFQGSGLVGVTIPPPFRAKVNYSTVTIKRFCVLGTNVIVLPGVTLEEGVAVGAGGLVRTNLDSWGVYVGVPVYRLIERERSKILEAARHLPI